MKISKKAYKLTAILLVIFFLCNLSCSDYLDVVPDNTATIYNAFHKRTQAEAYLYGIYGFVPQFCNPANNPSFLAGEEAWMMEEFSAFNISSWRIARGEQGTQSPLSNFWGAQSTFDYSTGGTPVFTSLNDCNVFLENIHYTIDLEEYEREQWISEVKFLKAYLHFWMLQLYGPVPIIDKNIGVGASTDVVMYYREPVDNVVEYIVGLLDEAAVNLPLEISNVTQDMGRITLPIALSLKAKVLMLAASPLFNGNPDYVDVVGCCGRHLFPQTYDPNKWEKAATAIKAAIDVCHQAGHQLFDFSKLGEASQVSNETILTQQAKGAATERWNSEIVWGDTNNPELLQRFGLHAFSHWQTYGAATRSWAPTLSTVKQFYTKNGVPIDEDKDWLSVDLFALRTGDYSHRYYIEQDYQTINLHFNREPRFYGAIAFDGGKIYGLGTISDANMLTTKFYFGVVEYQSNQHSVTGYLAKKMVHRLSSISLTGGESSMYRYAFPIIRLADLYLLYAEALNEIRSLSQSEINDYIDTIRKRSGLEGVMESWEKYSTDPEKPFSQNGMREIIQRERLNELAFEGQRFWDLRRWKLQKEYMNKPIQGWDIYGETLDEFYRVQTLDEPVFENKDYLWPIPQSALIKNSNLVQNPGWN